MREQPLTQFFRTDGKAANIQEYEAQGGYESVKLALKMKPHDIIEQVKASGLRGRGGGGFPTGVKWSLIPTDPRFEGTKYLVINADEMEPGTFKDRLLMERAPHLLVESIIASAYAIGASVAYLFLRWEYKLSESALKQAIQKLTNIII